MDKLLKKYRKQRTKAEHNRRIKRLNDITVLLMSGMTNTEKYKLVTGEMRAEMDMFYKGLYKIV